MRRLKEIKCSFGRVISVQTLYALLNSKANKRQENKIFMTSNHHMVQRNKNKNRFGVHPEY